MQKRIYKDYKHLTDEEIALTVSQAGDTALFGCLYDRYSDKVYNKCFSFVKNKDGAKDLMQDVFLRAYMKLNTYNPEKAAFSTWLYVVTYNLCTNYVSRNRNLYGPNEMRFGKKLQNEMVDEEVDIEEINALDADKLKLVLDRIPSTDKALLLLKYQDDASVKEIQTLLGVGESAIKMRLNRAKQKVVKTYYSL